MLDCARLQQLDKAHVLQHTASKEPMSGSRSASSLQTFMQTSTPSSSMPSPSTSFNHGSPNMINQALVSHHPSGIAASWEHSPTTKLQQQHPGRDPNHLLNTFDCQPQGPAGLSRHACNGTSGSADYTGVHGTPASSAPAATAGPFAGLPAFPSAPLPWQSPGLARNVSDLLRSSSWGSCGADQMDQSLQALARGTALGHDVTHSLDALRRGAFPMQAPSQQHVKKETPAAVASPNMNGHSPNISGMYPNSPQGSGPDWPPQQDLLNDWNLDMPAGGNASSALVNNAMLESMGMPDLPGFLGSAVQPAAGGNVAAWDCSTTKGPGAACCVNRRDQPAPRTKHHPSRLVSNMNQPAGTIIIKPEPAISHAEMQNFKGPVGLHPTPAPTGIPMPSCNMPRIRPVPNTITIRPSSQPLLPVTTGACRAPAARPAPGQPSHAASAAGAATEAAAKDVFNISSMDSILEQKRTNHSWGIPCGQAPTPHAAADRSAAQKPEGLRMSASDIETFLGLGDEASIPDSSGLRRSSRAPKPLKPIGEEHSGLDDEDDDDSMSEPEEAETPPSKRAKGTSGSSNSAGQQPRRRAGRPILPVENPSGGALTQEQQRLVRRRLHNRESARRSRSKRQATYEEQSDKVRAALGRTAVLEQQVAVLQGHCHQFQGKVMQLQASYAGALNECASLQQQLDQAQAGQPARRG